MRRLKWWFFLFFASGIFFSIRGRYTLKRKSAETELDKEQRVEAPSSRWPNPQK